MAGCGSTSENQSANQREETIFDNTAEAFIGTLKIFAANGNFDLSEPKFSTVDNKKYCTLNFGGSENNKVTLKLNPDDSIINAEISVTESSKYDAGKMAGVLLAGTFITTGVEDAELQKFLSAYQKIAEETVRKQNNTTTPVIDQDIKIYNAIKKKDFRVNIKCDDKQAKYFVELAR